MPNQPPTACSCGGIKVNGRCNRCKATKENRVNSNARGYNYEWRKYSREYRLEHPYCVHCLRQGKRTRGNQVDHIVEVNGQNDAGFWKRTNHQNLCRPCHNQKTELEKSGRYNHEQDLREAKEREGMTPQGSVSNVMRDEE